MFDWYGLYLPWELTYSITPSASHLVIDFIIKIVTLFFSNSLLQYSIGTACHSCHHITLFNRQLAEPGL